MRVNDGRSYGPIFNQNGGGWYAVERTDSYIKVWFWSRTSFRVPRDILRGERVVNTQNWVSPNPYTVSVGLGA